MFYVKENLTDALELSVEINDENVFCTCPHCGCEVQVYLAEVLRDKESDLYGTQVCCNDCSEKISKKRSED